METPNNKEDIKEKEMCADCYLKEVCDSTTDKDYCPLYQYGEICDDDLILEEANN